MDGNASDRFSAMVFIGYFPYSGSGNRLSCTTSAGGSFYDCGEQQAVESRGVHRLFFLDNNRRSYLSCRRIEQSILFEDGGCGSNGVCLRSVRNSIRWGLPSVPIFMGRTNPVRVTS